MYEESSQNKQGSEKEEPEGLDSGLSEGWGEYPLDSVFVRTETRTVRDVLSRIEANRYRLDPEFQRDFVWRPQEQSRLIESCLMRIPLPVFYVAEDPDGKIVVVDGLQRLTTFKRYVADEFPLEELSSQDSNSVISGKRFSELPLNLQERIEDTQLTLYILDAKAPERARLDIFDRVNSGVPLTRQQMRNSLYSGPATRCLKRLAAHKDFLNATGGSLRSSTMRDREFVNRFCAFYLIGTEDYRADIEVFLAASLIKMNKFSDEEIGELESVFLSSMKLNYKVFGQHCFRKSMAFDPSLRRTTLNVALFDVLSVLFVSHAETVTKNMVAVRKGMSKLIQEDLFFHESISQFTSSTSNVNWRFDKVNKMLAGLSHD